MVPFPVPEWILEILRRNVEGRANQRNNKGTVLEKSSAGGTALFLTAKSPWPERFLIGFFRDGLWSYVLLKGRVFKYWALYPVLFFCPCSNGRCRIKNSLDMYSIAKEMQDNCSKSIHARVTAYAQTKQAIWEHVIHVVDWLIDWFLFWFLSRLATLTGSQGG